MFDKKPIAKVNSQGGFTLSVYLKTQYFEQFYQFSKDEKEHL
jgi:hypothetical protein